MFGEKWKVPPITLPREKDCEPEFIFHPVIEEPCK